MNIALFFNSQKRDSKNLAIGIREFLTTSNVCVFTADSDAKEIGALALSSVSLDEIDTVLSLGGDGTILTLVHQYPDLNAPILGINTGHLGFMADVCIADIYPCLQNLLNGQYRVEERLKIEGHAPNGEKCYAVNDIVIHRARNPSLVEIAIHVDGSYLNTFEADGIIVATPNGSTAYSLAAGGPILSPTLQALVITPISPHTISNRPIVLTADVQIQIQYLSDYEPVEVCADGLSNFILRPGEMFNINRSTSQFKLINLSQRDYFSTLRTKLAWAGKLR